MQLLQEMTKATESCYDVSSFELAEHNSCETEAPEGLTDCSVYADNDLTELDVHTLEGDWYVVGYTATTTKHWDAGVARFSLEEGVLQTVYTGFKSPDSDECFAPETHTHQPIEGHAARFETDGSHSKTQRNATISHVSLS